MRELPTKCEDEGNLLFLSRVESCAESELLGWVDLQATPGAEPRTHSRDSPCWEVPRCGHHREKMTGWPGRYAAMKQSVSDGCEYHWPGEVRNGFLPQARSWRRSSAVVKEHQLPHLAFGDFKPMHTSVKLDHGHLGETTMQTLSWDVSMLKKIITIVIIIIKNALIEQSQDEKEVMGERLDTGETAAFRNSRWG